MQRLQDIALITQVVTFGSERAFSQLVRAHQEAVRRFLLRLTAGDAMRADDLAQETFIRAWQELSSFRQLSGFQTWLLSIAYRVFLDDVRKNKLTIQDTNPTLPIEEQTETRARTAPEESSWAVRHDLDLALATLAETERTCVVLQCAEGQSIKEIANITGLYENTVKSHLMRGKKKLAEYLRKNGYHG